MNFLNKIFNSGRKKERKIDDKQPKKPAEYKLGEFDILDFPEGDRNKSFYFYEYEQQDGEWINIDESICKIRIGEYNGYMYKSASVLASKSGILEHTLKKDDLLKDKTISHQIHDKGSYKFENSIENPEYKDYFKTLDYKNTFDKWLVNDGDFVNIGEQVYQFNDSNYTKHINYSKKAGFIYQIDPKKIVNLDNNELMYIVRDSDKQRIMDRFLNNPDLIVDDFTNSTIIKWHRVSSRFEISHGIKTKSDNFITDFLFSFNFIDNNDFIVFHFEPKQIRPKQFDKVSFLFENGEQIKFELETDPISSKNRLNEKILEYKGIITQSELELFANTNFKKWKISLISDKREVLGGETSGDYFYPNKNNIQIIIKKFASEYINLVKKTIPDYQPTVLKQSDRIKDVLNGFCFVYLMHDISNGYYKIGISNNPEYRERTLQSEKPTIEMIISKKYPIRKIAESIEKALHDTYSKQRLRGEWFDLETKDVEHVKETLR